VNHMQNVAMELDAAVTLLHRITTPGYLDPLMKALAALDHSEGTTNYTRVALEAGRAELLLLHLWRAIENALRASALFAAPPTPGNDDNTRAIHLSSNDLAYLASVAGTVHSIADSFHELMRACIKASLQHKQTAAACARTIQVIKKESARLLPSDDHALRLLRMQGVGTTFVNSNGLLTRIDEENS